LQCIVVKRQVNTLKNKCQDVIWT